jgi:hypothetical protein
MLAACAKHRQVAKDKLLEWAESQGLRDPNRFMPALSRALEEIVGPDGWLFDRTLVEQ